MQILLHTPLHQYRIVLACDNNRRPCAPPPRLTRQPWRRTSPEQSASSGSPTAAHRVEMYRYESPVAIGLIEKSMQEAVRLHPSLADSACIPWDWDNAAITDTLRTEVRVGVIRQIEGPMYGRILPVPTAACTRTWGNR